MDIHDFPYENESPCHYRRALEVVSSKWTVLVFYELEDGKKRYSDLKRRVEGVTQKMLTQTLRQLERDGLVLRHVYPTVPPTVEYSLTPLGESLIEPMRTLHRWTEAHYDQVLLARKAFDRDNP
ncbi:winged helix-turn-helix transcriptional regulator [Paenibacillus aceris]|uniref:DNA-binding HxlR family transcriptional regulator n=1 Tax=Paenibacillus aceris TaxID=869555 RepID=A0ABS4HW25_9BACL|nr:helix-turn-helix domain-containing protein [Paenibacillus aceris]MBP1962818.1 DNA-binding HxlR family transcriptional regulator [Paenibacillus aceris]NHW38248.1 helix-turn-helix transcriptional regulator [Paenibacillus aceris]